MKGNPTSHAGESASGQSRYQRNAPKRILVVDDDEVIRQVNAEMLSHFGYETETAEDGAEAWEALQANVYDLLITDNSMPKVSGVELVKKLRSAHMTLPVVLATGTIPMEAMKRNSSLQLAAMLVKPFTMDELLATVKEVLRAANSAASGASRCPPGEASRPPGVYGYDEFNPQSSMRSTANLSGAQRARQIESRIGGIPNSGPNDCSSYSQK